MYSLLTLGFFGGDFIYLSFFFDPPFLTAFLFLCRMLHFQAAPGQFKDEVRQPGLRCWRVEKMKAVPLAQAEVGAFFNGDSYLVLDNRGDQGADLHMWIGEMIVADFLFWFILSLPVLSERHRIETFSMLGDVISHF